MNSHKNVRLTSIHRVEMAENVLKFHLPDSQAARLYGVSAATKRKWLGRFLAEGKPDLVDRSSRPTHSPRAIDASKALNIVELRWKRMTQARIA